MRTEPPTDFIHRFHNLEGDTVGERKRNFFKLIRDPDLFSDESQMNDTLKNLEPKTYLESLFKVDALIHFRQTSELLEILKQGNEVFISKILKSSWFFDIAFENMDPETLVDEFLPHTSYAVRTKLVKIIARFWNEEKVNVLYDSLEKRYGIYVAKTILHECSASKIEGTLKENEVRLTVNQVKHLLDKNEKLFKNYLDHVNHLDSNETYSASYEKMNVLKYLALKNPKLLLELEKNRKIKCSVVGRRTSKKIVGLAKDDILKDPEHYAKFLNSNVVVRKFGANFGVLYKQLFPRKISGINVNATCNKLLLFYPKSHRWGLFCRTFSEIFPNKSLEHILLKLDDSFLALQPTNEVIAKWAKMHYEKDENNDFLKYFPPHNAIPMLKEKINLTSDRHKRGSLVRLLLETCAQHKDLDTLEEVLTYISIRHRNENPIFRQLLIQTISDSFKLDDLKENHWNCINDQIKISRIKKEFNFWEYRKLLENHLAFLFKNQKESEPFLLEYINDNFESYGGFQLDIDDCRIKKQILIEMSKLYDKVLKNKKDRVYSLFIRVFDFSVQNSQYCINPSELSSAAISFINNCFVENTDLFYEGHHLRNQVILYHVTFPGRAFLKNEILLNALANSIKEKKSFYDFTDLYKKCLSRENRSSLVTGIINLYLDELLEFSYWEPVRWLLRNEPRRLVPHFEKIIRSSRTKFFDKQLKLFTHFDFDKQAGNFYKEELQREECDSKRRILKNLVSLSTTDELVELVNRYFLPQKDKLDLEDVQMQKVYSVQCEVAKVLHQVEEPYKMLPVVMEFCKGDYLQSAIPSLYGVFYKSPEKLLYPYVKLLEGRRLSSKKHAAYLSCEVLHRKHVFDVLNIAKDDEAASQKYLLSTTLKYFQKNPSIDLLDMIIAILPSLEKNDSETFDLVKNIKMPMKYRTLFIEKCWPIFENLREVGMIVKECLESFLRLMSLDTLKSLSADFVKHLISRYFVSEEILLLGFDNFVMKVLEYRESERPGHFPMVFTMLVESKKKYRSRFFDCFINIPESKAIDMSFVNMFVKYWKEHFSVSQSFEEHISLNLFLIKLHSLSSSQQYAEDIVCYLEELISEFNLHVLNIFKEQFRQVTDKMENMKKYCLFNDMLKFKCLSSTCILILELMNHVEDEESEIFEQYCNIIDLIKNNNEPIVQIYCNLYLSAVEK